MVKDAEIFTRLYSEAVKDLYKFALYLLKYKEDAEDAVSETALDAFSQMEQLRDEKLFRNWIMKILVNKCRRKLKEYAINRVETTEDIARVSDGMASKEARPDGFWRLGLKEMLMTLNNEERFIVCLSVLGGYKGEEIADILHINPVTLRSKKKRALAKLAEYLEN